MPAERRFLFCFEMDEKQYWFVICENCMKFKFQFQILVGTYQAHSTTYYLRLLWCCRGKSWAPWTMYGLKRPQCSLLGLQENADFCSKSSHLLHLSPSLREGFSAGLTSWFISRVGSPVCYRKTQVRLQTVALERKRLKYWKTCLLMGCFLAGGSS